MPGDELAAVGLALCLCRRLTSCGVEGGGGTQKERLGIWALKMSMGGIFLQAHGWGESSSPPAQWKMSCTVAEMLMAGALGCVSCRRGHPAAHPG